VTFENV